MPELSKAALLKRLDDEHAALAATVAGLTEEQMAHRFEGSDGWTSVEDVVKHLASGERGMLTVAQRCAAGGEPPSYAGFDLDRWNIRQVEKLKTLTPAEALAQYDAVRQQAKVTLESLSEDQLARPASHPVFGQVTVGGLFRIMAIHEQMHRRDIVRMRGR
jgi:hypothetical protein